MSKREKIQRGASRRVVENNFRGILDIAPRVGKTKIVIDAIRDSGFKVLIAVPYNNLVDVWMEEFKTWGLSFIPDIINQASLNKIPRDNDYDLIIIDEIHQLSEGQLESLEKLGASKLLGLTGTLTKEKYRLLNDLFLLDVIYRYTIEQAISDGIIANYEINIVTCNLDDKNKIIPAGTKKVPFLTTEIKQYAYLTKQFNKFKYLSWKDDKYINIKMAWAGKRSRFLYSALTKVELAKKVISNYDRCLVFTGLIDIAEQLCEHAYHSKSDENNLNLFINGEIDKLAVIQMIQLGITIPNLKVGIFHQMKSTEEQAIQKIMRLCNVEEDDRDAQIWILAYNATVDEGWVEKALKGLDSRKINYVDGRSL